MNKGTWPARTSVAVFQFTTKEAASNWFEDFSGKCQTFDLKIDDAISAATRDLYQNGECYKVLQHYYPNDI